jgi:Glutathione peroxidase
MSDIYAIEVRTIDGRNISMSEYQGRVLLIVNTATRCGFAPQFAGLEQLYRKYRDQGFAVLGFPCNQFAGQEPGDEAEIASICSLNHGVTFPLFAKVDVNGPDQHPLFRLLKRKKSGFLGSKAIKWNFTKFLVDRGGAVVKRYGPATRPEQIEADIRRLL